MKHKEMQMQIYRRPAPKINRTKEKQMFAKLERVCYTE